MEEGPMGLGFTGKIVWRQFRNERHYYDSLDVPLFVSLLMLESLKSVAISASLHILVEDRI